jgi:phage/plasmid primase-like uncharacterized protein
LLVDEGIETTLSAMVLSGYQGVSAIDAGNFASVWLPPCSEIIVLKDRDNGGHKAVEGVIARYGATKTIRVAVPPKGASTFGALMILRLRNSRSRSLCRASFQSL